MSDSPIGIIDSGLGGLSVWKDITVLLPHESTLYVGDHAYVPYGNKGASFIRKRIIAILRWFTSQNVKLAVIACNTATVAGIDKYRKTFPKLPIIGVVPVVKTAAHDTKTGHFAVLTTEFTAKSSYHTDLIKQYAKDRHVTTIGCPNLVTLIEDGTVSGRVIHEELSKLLSPVKKSTIDIIALGCTHYPFIIREIQSIIGKNVRLLDSGEAVARHTKRILEHNNDLRVSETPPKHRLYTTGSATHVTRIASKLLARPISVNHIDC